MSNDKKIPLHEDSMSVVPLAPFIATAVTNNTSGLATATSVVSLGSGTKFVRFYAEGGTVVVSLSGTASSSSFDIVVPSGQVVDIYDYDTFAKDGYSVVSAIKITGTVTNFIVLEY